MANLIFPELSLPFAAKDSAIIPPQFLTSDNFSIPHSLGGKVLTRHMMNGYGYIASLGYFLDQIGYTYSLPIAHLFSDEEGYNIACKRRYDGKRRLREYYGSGTNEPPFNEGEDPTGLGNENWTPTINYKNSYSFPVLDVDSAEIVYSGIKNTDDEFIVDVEFPLSPCWVYVKRTISKWNELSAEIQDAANPTLILNQLSFSETEYQRNPEYYNLHYGYSDSILFLEGATAGRLFPLGECNGRHTIRLQIPSPNEGDSLVEDYGGIEIEVRYFNLPA